MLRNSNRDARDLNVIISQLFTIYDQREWLKDKDFKR